MLIYKAQVLESALTEANNYSASISLPNGWKLVDIFYFPPEVSEGRSVGFYEVHYSLPNGTDVSPANRTNQTFQFIPLSTLTQGEQIVLPALESTQQVYKIIDASNPPTVSPPSSSSSTLPPATDLDIGSADSTQGMVFRPQSSSSFGVFLEVRERDP